MSSVPPKDISIASASVATMRTLGQTISMGILTMIFSYIMGNVAITPEHDPQLITSSQITCIICTVLCILSVLASLVGIKHNVKS